MAWAAGKLEELRASDLRVQVLPSHMEKYRDPKSNPLRKIVAKAIDFVRRSGGIFGGEGGGLFHVAAERTLVCPMAEAFASGRRAPDEPLPSVDDTQNTTFRK